MVRNQENKNRRHSDLENHECFACDKVGHCTRQGMSSLGGKRDSKTGGRVTLPDGKTSRGKQA